MLASLFPRAHARYTSVPILGGSLEGLCVWLDARGYSRDAIQQRMGAAARLARALQRRDVPSLTELTASVLRSCLPPPRRSHSPPLGALVRSLTLYLGERGELAVTPPTPAELRVAEYQRYLKRVRGLSAVTISAHSTIVVEFLRCVDDDLRPLGLRELRGPHVEEFVVRACRHMSRSSMAQITGTLRSYLRFLAAREEVPPGLDAHVESPRIWRGERLPRALAWDLVRALLQSIDRTTPMGRRDYAMFLLIATYGLRVSEVAALELDDVAWRARQVRVPRPKIGTPLLLPLTDEVGAALLDYLRYARPPSTHRALFLRIVPPLGPLKGGAVTAAFRRAAARAGIPLPPRGGPHSLRHALAIHLLREGTTLKTIGDLLGHRCVETTSVYLRLDIDDLRDVALPLPAAVLQEQVRP